jgi:hypothetical protein
MRSSRVRLVRITQVALLAPLVATGLAVSGTGRALAAGLPPDLTMQPLTEIPTSGESSNVPQLNAVACPTAVTCLAVGVITTVLPSTDGLFSVGTETSGVWNWNPAVDTGSSGASSYQGIACPSATTCIAVGTDGEVNGFYEGAVSVINENQGAWSLTSTTAIDGWNHLYAISCPTSDQCVAIGDARGPSQDTPAWMTLDFDGELWTPTSPTFLVDNAQISPGSGKISVRWETPLVSSAGPVTAYTAKATGADDSFTCTTSAERCVISGLTNGTAYEVSVVATNRVGSSNASQPSQSTIAGTPDAPNDVKTRVVKDRIKVTFRLRANNGSAITSQEATCISSNGGVSKSKTHHGRSTAAIYISHVTAGKSYTCTVSATNERGAGPPSSASRTVKP